MELMIPLARAFRRSRRGTLLIDALLAVSIFGAIFSAFSSGIMQGRLGTVWSSEKLRAVYLAQEGLHAMHYLRDRRDGEGDFIGYDIIAAYEMDVDHGVRITDGSWEFVENTPTIIDNFFTQSIRLSAGNNENERTVQSTVSWNSSGMPTARSITLTSLLTNWPKDPPPPPPDWSQPIIKGSLTDSLFDEPEMNKIAVSGSYVYITAALDTSNGYGLHVVDVSDLEDPELVNSVDLNFAGAYDVVLYDHYAYFSTDDPTGEIKIVDVTDPVTAHCSPCAGTIDLPSIGLANGMALTGTGLFITRVADVAADELYIYDVGDDTVNPQLINSYDTDPSTDHLYAVATAGANPMAPYAYVASGTSNNEELRVVNTTGGVLTGNGSAGGNTQGTAVAIYATGAYVGASGNDACEVFSFDLTNKVHNPNASPTCGGNQAYDLGGTSDPKDVVFDMDLTLGNNMEFPHLFMAIDRKITGISYRHLQILKVDDVRNINSASKKIYDDDITIGYGAGRGVAYRLSDHTLFLIGGESWETSHLLILWPTYTY